MSDTQVLIPTGRLRWLKRKESMPVLQLLYRDTAGRDVWQDVPEVTE